MDGYETPPRGRLSCYGNKWSIAKGTVNDFTVFVAVKRYLSSMFNGYSFDGHIYRYNQLSKTPRRWDQVRYNNVSGVFMTIAADEPVCAVSRNGITWKEYELPDVLSNQWMVIENGLFILSSATGDCYESPDGKSWVRNYNYNYYA